ncbi:MAG: dihydroneopterin aldolase [Bacteroidetes bacterium]|nr:dihydroneopterin aldolase [Bacteroidota bacterium]
MNSIEIEGIKIYAYHGCLAEEAKIGGHYIVDVYINVDFEESAITDDLAKTIDYVTVYDIVKKEMAIRSKLIEHVARRINLSIKNTFAEIHQVKVKVTKIVPPMNGNVEKVSVVY